LTFFVRGVHSPNQLWAGKYEAEQRMTASA